MRPIPDTRQANCFFEEPPHTELPSPEALGDLVLPRGAQLYLATGDVEVCFYQYALPRGLRRFFVLPGVRRRYLSARMRARFPPGELDDEVQVSCCVVPMGWSWAVHWIQAAQLRMLEPPGPRRWLADKREAGQLPEEQLLGALYIDNFAAFSLDPATATEAASCMQRALGDHGVVSHLDGPAATDGELIGFRLVDGRRWQLTDKKFWKLSLALRWLLLPGRLVTPKELERVAGHVVAAFTIKRELLSVLHALYVFLQRAPQRRQVLWPSVKAELRWVLALLPLAAAALDAPWCETVTAVDASEAGFGVCEASWGHEQAGEVGALRERSRFRGPLAPSAAPRERALEVELRTLSDEKGTRGGAEQRIQGGAARGSNGASLEGHCLSPLGAARGHPAAGGFCFGVGSKSAGACTAFCWPKAFIAQ